MLRIQPKMVRKWHWLHYDYCNNWELYHSCAQSPEWYNLLPLSTDTASTADNSFQLHFPEVSDGNLSIQWPVTAIKDSPVGSVALSVVKDMEVACLTELATWGIGKRYWVLQYTQLPVLFFPKMLYPRAQWFWCDVAECIFP